MMNLEIHGQLHNVLKWSEGSEGIVFYLFIYFFNKFMHHVYIIFNGHPPPPIFPKC